MFYRVYSFIEFLFNDNKSPIQIYEFLLLFLHRVEDAGTITDEYISASTRKQSVLNNNTGSVELVVNDMYSG